MSRILLSILLLILPVFSALQDVTLQLKWTHQFQFAGFYAAKHFGYYEEKGLDVTIIEGSSEIEPVDEILEGRATFSLAMPDVLLQQSEGDPIAIVSPVFPHSPFVLLAHRDVVGDSIDGIIGKRIEFQETESGAIRAMLLEHNITDENTIFNPYERWGLDRVDTDSVDVLSAYTLDLPYFFKTRDSSDYIIFDPKDYGIDFYGDIIVTHDKTLKNSPKLVQAFREASIRGWKYALDNPTEVAGIIKQKYDTYLTKEELLIEAREVRKVMLPQYIDIGVGSNERWRHIVEKYKEIGALPESFELDTSRIFQAGATVQTPFWVRQLILVLMLTLLFFGIFNWRLRAEVSKKVTEVEQKERRFRSIFDDSTQIIAILNADGTVQTVNKVALEIANVEQKKVAGIPYWKAPWWRHSTRIQHELQQALKQALNGDPVAFETSLVDHHGKNRIIDFTLSAICASNGKVDFLIATGYDLTHLREIEDRDRHLQKMEAIGTLAGGIAHDFNNILAAMFGYLDLASLEEHGNDHLHEAHDEIRTAAKRAKDLVGQILTFSRKSSVQMEPVQLATVVEEAMRLIRSSIPSTISIDQRINDDSYILANGTQLHQVIMNICTNGYHAMREQSSGLLSITLELVETTADMQEHHPELDNGEYVQLRISDTGTGMDNGTLEQVFNPYFTTKKGSNKGTGLGLSTVHTIITSHEGVIDVASKPGVGTTFTLLFPRIDHTPIQLPEMQETEQKEVSPKSASSETAHVMFVDDEQMIVKSFGKFLRQAGFEVTTFTDSTEALEEFEQDPQRYSIIVSDMTMPVMNGIDMIKTMKTIREDIPTILCSGYNHEVDTLRETVPEITQFLQKPIGMKELISEIENLL